MTQTAHTRLTDMSGYEAEEPCGCNPLRRCAMHEAAPDLLAALEHAANFAMQVAILADMDGIKSSAELARKYETNYRAAIAKARGQ